MKTKLLLWALFAGVFILSCSEDDDGGREPEFIPQGYLKVGNQIYGDGTVTIDYVQLNHDGWVAIYRYSDKREELLGYTFLKAGLYKNLLVELEEFPALGNEDRLLAMLHLDENENGVFDWDGEAGIDLPLKRWDVEVGQQFSLYISPEYADHWLTVENQILTSGPFWAMLFVTEVDLDVVDELLESNTVWIVAYNWGVNGPNEIIGSSDVLQVRKHEEVTIWIWGAVESGEIIWLVLHEGTGEKGLFEDTDPIVWDAERQKRLMAPLRILY